MIGNDPPATWNWWRYFYGVGFDAAQKMNGLGVVADALNRGELARAQIATLLLKLPDPERIDGGAGGLRKLAALFEAGWLAKEWEDSEHPRAGVPPNPGGFAPTHGGAGDPSKPKAPAGTQVAQEEEERFP